MTNDMQTKILRFAALAAQSKLQPLNSEEQEEKDAIQMSLNMSSDEIINTAAMLALDGKKSN